MDCRWIVVLTGLLASAGGVRSAPPIDPDEGRPRVLWNQAESAVGRIAFVAGVVTETGRAGRVHFLEFDPSTERRFRGVVFEENLADFPGSLESLYVGKTVQIRGFVTRYAGKPQIVVRHPTQIAVLDKLPPPVEPVAVKRAAQDRLTIASFNVLNLFDDVDDPYTFDETTPPKPRHQLERLAQTIRALDADVVALQEVESEGYLRRFLEVFLSDMGYQYVVAVPGNDTRGSGVGLVSRVPVGTVISHRHIRRPGADGSTQQFRRDLLAVELWPEDAAPLEVWVLHLKSNYDGREHAESIRMGEARLVRALLDQRFRQSPDARLIVCGDFNDTWDSATLRTIVGEGATALAMPLDELPTERRITYNKDPYRSMIDFLLLTPALRDQYIPGTLRILDGSVEASGSDHNPLVLSIRP